MSYPGMKFFQPFPHEYYSLISRKLEIERVLSAIFVITILRYSVTVLYCVPDVLYS